MRSIERKLLKKSPTKAEFYYFQIIKLPVIQRIGLYREAIIWTAGLLLLYFMETGSDFSFCIFRMMGFSSCPGCGIGHSIHHALHFEWEESIQHHMLGIPITLIITAQSIRSIIKPKLKQHGPKNVNDVTRH